MGQLQSCAMVNCCQPVTSRDGNELDTTYDREDEKEMTGPRASGRNNNIMKPKNGEKQQYESNTTTATFAK